MDDYKILLEASIERMLFKLNDKVKYITDEDNNKGIIIGVSVYVNGSYTYTVSFNGELAIAYENELLKLNY